MFQAENNGIAEHLNRHAKVLEQFRAGDIPSIERVSALMVTAIREGHKIIAFGNGGSAAQAQHFVAELTGQFLRKRYAFPALAITADTSVLTAVANDFGFEYVFVRQCEALARPGDVVLGITTSGQSRNVVAVTQELHLVCLHILCQLIEEAF
jgi:D-sedoheptulose 7-phosphate isomerase